MSGTEGVSAGDARARQAQEEAARRIREQEPVRLEPTTPPKPVRIGGYYLPPMSDESLRQLASNHGLPPPALADLNLYTKDLLEREIDATRARLVNKPGPEGDAERLSLMRLEGALAVKCAPPIADLAKLDSIDALDREILEEQIFLRRYASTAPPDVLHEHQQQLAALNDKRADVFERDSVCDKAKTAHVQNLPDGRPFVTVTADELIATINRQVPMSVFQADAVRRAFNTWRLDTCRSTGVDPTTIRSSTDLRLGADHLGDQEREMRMRVEMFLASGTSAAASLAFLDSAIRGDTLEAAHARVLAASRQGDLASLLPVRGSATTGVAPDTRVEVEHSRVEIPSRDGAASKSRLDAPGQSMMNRAEKAALPTFQPNADGSVRSMSEAVAIAEKNGVTVPSFIKFVADPSVPIAKRFAEYQLAPQYTTVPASLTWEKAAPGGVIVVRVHPSVLASDENIVGVIQHEVYELSSVHDAIARAGGNMSSARVNALIDDESDNNLHGKAWDIADSRVLIMRETDPTRKAMLVERLNTRLAQFNRMNGGVR